MIVKKKCHKKVQTNIFYQNRRVLERIYKIYKRMYLIGKKNTFFNAEPTNFGLYLIKRFKKKTPKKTPTNTCIFFIVSIKIQTSQPGSRCQNYFQEYSFI